MSDTGAWSPRQQAREREVIDELVAARVADDAQAIARAREELILMHTGFVTYVAHKDFGHVDEDILQAGTRGLIEAVDRFDPQHGTQLTSFAVHHIRAAMRECRDNGSWDVHAPRHLRQLSGRIRALEQQHVGAPLSVAQIAERLDVQMHEVLDAKSLDHMRFAASLDAVASTDDRSELMADDVALAQVEARETLRALLECLDDRERTVVTGLMLEGRVQQELADSLGISQSQVCRIREAALDRMRAAHKG